MRFSFPRPPRELVDKIVSELRSPFPSTKQCTTVSGDKIDGEWWIGLTGVWVRDSGKVVLIATDWRRAWANYHAGFIARWRIRNALRIHSEIEAEMAKMRIELADV